MKVMDTSGAGTFPDTMAFHYQVQAGDLDADGFGVSANSLRFNGDGIHDRAGNAACPCHLAVPANPGHKVDANPENHDERG